MKSMTGYGKAVVERAGRELTVEIKSVNHRFLDMNLKLPKIFWQFEDIVRKTISVKVARGHIDLFVTYADYSQSGKECEIDYGLAKAYADAARALSERFGVPDDLTATSLIRSQDVFTVRPAEIDAEALSLQLKEAVDQALEALDVMRVFEGEKMKNDLENRISNVETLTSEIEKFAPRVVTDYKARLTARINEILEEGRADETRLDQEVCFFADKCNIDEEIARLHSHVDHFRKMLADENPVGRSADFLVQELNRETNTVCSKSNDTELTRLGLQLKNEVEKIREQIQNIE